MSDLPGPAPASGDDRGDQRGYGITYGSRWERCGYTYGTSPDVRGGWLGDGQRQAEGAGGGDSPSVGTTRESAHRTASFAEHLDDIDRAILGVVGRDVYCCSCGSAINHADDKCAHCGYAFLAG